MIEMIRRRALDEVYAAVRFLTILPVAAPRASCGASMFPVVGLAIGMLAAVADHVLGVAAPALRSTGTVAFLAILCGGLHYDGLADMCDAFGGSSVQDRLRILRDEAVGSFGALALILVVSAKLFAVASMVGPNRVRALIMAPAIGRFAILLTAFHSHSARPEGLGHQFVRSLDGFVLACATATLVIATSLIAGPSGLTLISAAMVTAALLRWVAFRLFGGINGDVLGAASEIAETLALGLLGTVH